MGGCWWFDQSLGGFAVIFFLVSMAVAAAIYRRLGWRVCQSSILGLFLACVGHGGWIVAGFMGFWWCFEGREQGCGWWSDGSGLGFWMRSLDWPWWKHDGRMGRWGSLRGWVVVSFSLIIRLGMGWIAYACTILATVVIGRPVLESWGRKGDCGGCLLFLIRAFFLVGVFWLGFISPYSFELGLGNIVVPCWWRYSQGQFDQSSVYFCCQFADERSLHVVWYDWSAVWKRAVVFLAVVYEVLSRLLGLFFTSNLWKVMSVVRVWVLSTHGICNRFGVRFYVLPVSWDVRGSFITRVVGKGDTTACRSRFM